MRGHATLLAEPASDQRRASNRAEMWTNDCFFFAQRRRKWYNLDVTSAAFYEAYDTRVRYTCAYLVKVLERPWLAL